MTIAMPALPYGIAKQGSTEWRDGLPLLRLNGERIYSESRVDLITPNMFAGSVLDLKPDTDYEARFIIDDPDGVIGNAGTPGASAHSCRTPALRRRPGTSCLPPWPHRRKAGACLRGADVCL